MNGPGFAESDTESHVECCGESEWANLQWTPSFVTNSHYGGKANTNSHHRQGQMQAKTMCTRVQKGVKSVLVNGRRSLSKHCGPVLPSCENGFVVILCASAMVLIDCYRKALH